MVSQITVELRKGNNGKLIRQKHARVIFNELDNL